MQLAVYSLLDGALTYEGNPVPTFDEKRNIAGDPNIYVLLSTQTETASNDSATDCVIATESTIDIEIIHKTGYEITKKAIHSIADQILGAIITGPGSGLIEAEGFQVLNQRRTRSVTRNFSLTESQSVISRIITISATFIEN